MNKKELRHAFNTVLAVAERAACKDLHHKESQYHGADELCPVEYEIAKCAYVVRQYMKENNLG